MSERERKIIAFLLGVIFKLSMDRDVDANEVHQLVNLMDEFGTYDLDEEEFRY